MAASAFCLAFAAVPVQSAEPPGLGPWVTSGHSAARLLALGPQDAPGVRRAAVEIRLDPGFLTYWRQPGEAGLPPSFDTSRSDNIAAVAVDYPAPGLFEEGGVPLFGYRDTVTFPLAVTLKDPDRPASLVVGLGYAVCANICLPGKADMRLQLPATSDPEVAASIAAAEAAVPRRVALGAPGPLGIESVAPDRGAPGGGLQVTARANTAATLFVEGPEGWIFSAGRPADRGGSVAFPVTVEARPSEGAAGPVDLRLTLVEPAGSIEVPVRMDARTLTP